MRPIQLAFKKLGIRWDVSAPVAADSAETVSLTVPAEQTMQVNTDIGGMIPKIDDAPWPGFPPDLTSIMTVVATQVEGTVLIHEKMFESRMFFVDKLIGMGARITLCDPHRAVVSGPSILRGEQLVSPDVRAGMAMVIAAMCARGESIISNIYQVERGYENLTERLKNLGAHIKKVM
jgi:UDP-N-acetylglucosamine 1-carboxyvinyltransferase